MPSSRLRLFALSSFLLACALPACSSDPEAPPAQENASDPLAEALGRDTGVTWVVYRDEAGRAIIAAPLATPRTLVPGGTPEAVARDFFDRYGSLLGAKDPK